MGTLQGSSAGHFLTRLGRLVEMQENPGAVFGRCQQSGIVLRQ